METSHDDARGVYKKTLRVGEGVNSNIQRYLGPVKEKAVRANLK